MTGRLAPHLVAMLDAELEVEIEHRRQAISEQ
jgi:hypothetical protein